MFVDERMTDRARMRIWKKFYPLAVQDLPAQTALHEDRDLDDVLQFCIGCFQNFGRQAEHVRTLIFKGRRHDASAGIDSGYASRQNEVANSSDRRDRIVAMLVPFDLEALSTHPKVSCSLKSLHPSLGQLATQLLEREVDPGAIHRSPRLQIRQYSIFSLILGRGGLIHLLDFI